ncbi:sialate O-acetylesterase [Gordonia sp. JH63]|uniref:sialate O-acetylesterase n=1 Tax=Gordonia TaxID=2053 RepID=UPI00132001D9|nr:MULTISPECIES: sialate O-acetylesterase [Gordonia]QHD84820.1 sialate O-acetylesterase [Gordonia sp. JH63]UPG69214.1 sialate O-acetylesterase [Gordonia hongkongensis]
MNTHPVPSEQDLRRHGDAPLTVQWTVRAKDAVKRLRASGTEVEPAGNYSVVAVLGQSNAHGAGRLVPGQRPPVPDPRVHQWPGCGRRRGRVLLAEDPLLHEIPGAGAGFATTFGSLLAVHTGRPVLLVPSARGDTAFRQKNGYSWDRGNRTARVNLYDLAVRQIANALTAAGRDSRLAAILWHQGESDVPLTRPEVYRDKLDALINGLRDEFGPVPFLLGRMVPEEIATGHPGYPGIDSIHADVPSRHRSCACVAGPRGMHNPGELIHYNAEGQQHLGHAMFEAYRRLESSSPA